MKARMDMRKTPDLQATIKVLDARVDNAFLPVKLSTSKPVTLTRSYNRSRGQSQYDMIRRLNGNGRSW